MQKIKSTFKFLSSTTLISIFIIFLMISIYFINIYNNLNTPVIDALFHPEVTRIYSDNNEEIKILGELDPEEAKFEDLPDAFIYALLSIEDQRFFIHDGYDVNRLVASSITNIKEMRFAEGASTLTQQLIKNKKLDNDKNVNRKINEIFLATKLEKSLSKEEIFMLYVNQILFDGVKPGINHASLRFFGKKINDVTLPEAALLAALVKSPTIYSPIINKENALNRKNLVLEMMAKNNYISSTTKKLAQEVQIDDMLKDEEYIEPAYDFQSYLDVVYREVEELTGLNPYINPMRIYTHMNKDLQTKIDNIQNNLDSSINFIDNYQQIGGAILDNNQDAIIGIIGGRNYQGEKIFNRAINMKQQPASTIKPILSYALAIEKLGWTNEHVLIDEPYFYPGTETEVRNVDRIHMGELTLEEALGYSRNTLALSTLDQVMTTIGKQEVINYLKNINLMDSKDSDFNSAYAIGAFNYGVSPLELANAYKMLAQDGIYSKSTTIKKIEFVDSSLETIIPSQQQNKLLSSETTYKLSRVLKEVVNRNYWGLGTLKIKDVEVFGKSGTSSFDSNFALEYGYPSNASKDIWIAGYTPDYTCTIWTGFDRFIKNESTYFSSSDSARKNIPRILFENLISSLPSKNTSLKSPDTLERVRIIKGYYPYVIADETIPEKYVTYSYFKKDEIPYNNTLAIPVLPTLIEPSIFIILNQLDISIPPLEINYRSNPNYKTIFSYENLYGKIIYFVEITSPSNQVTTLSSENNNITYMMYEEGVYKVNIFYGYLNKPEMRSNVLTYDIPNF